MDSVGEAARAVAAIVPAVRFHHALDPGSAGAGFKANRHLWISRKKCLKRPLDVR